MQAIALEDATFIRTVLGANSADDHARFGAELVASLGPASREGYFAACTNDVERRRGGPRERGERSSKPVFHPAVA